MISGEAGGLEEHLQKLPPLLVRLIIQKGRRLGAAALQLVGVVPLESRLS